MDRTSSDRSKGNKLNTAYHSTALRAETSGQHCATGWNCVGKYFVLGTLSYQHYEPTPPARAGIKSNIKVCIKIKTQGSHRET